MYRYFSTLSGEIHKKDRTAASRAAVLHRRVFIWSKNALLIFGYGKPFQRTASAPAGIIHLRAFPELSELLLCGHRVAVYLPEACELAGTFFDESLNILRGIAEEKAYLVGKFLTFSEPAAEPGDTFFRTSAVIAALSENVPGSRAAEVVSESLRPVDIDKCLIIGIPERHDSESLFTKSMVKGRELLAHLIGA